MPVHGYGRWPPDKIFFVAFLLPGLAAAFTKEAHAQVVTVATKLLSPAKLARVNKILQGDIHDLASWEEEMTRKYPTTERMHWHRQVPSWECAKAVRDRDHDRGSVTVTCSGDASVHKDSLMCALPYFFEHFVHAARLDDFPETKIAIGKVPDRLPALDPLTSVELTSAKYLRWIIILMGDLHQPLRLLSTQEDGTRIKVKHSKGSTTLFDFFDDVLTKNIAPLPTDSYIRTRYSIAQKNFAGIRPTELFVRWAEENSAQGCMHIIDGVQRAEKDSEGQYVIDKMLFDELALLSRDLIVTAGVHLAWVLEDILEHRKHHAAHKEGRGKYSYKKTWKQNLATNLGLAAIIVPALLLFFKWQDGGGATAILRMFGGTKHLKS